MDGLYYATLSLRVAENNFNPFALHFMDQHFNLFYEHPPLKFIMQAFFFTIFGDAFYTEHIYALSMLLLQLLLIAQIFKNVINGNKAVYWLPMLLYTSVYSIIWAFSNNMIENTLGVFMLLAVLLYQKFIRREKVFFLIFAGIAVFLGFLTKGPTALFPLAIPFLYFISYNSLNRQNFLNMLKQVLIVFSAAIFPFLILYLSVEDFSTFFNAYFNHQILKSLTSVSTVSSRFYIIQRFLIEALPPLLICILLGIIDRRAFKWHDKQVVQPALFFFLIALSSVLPIMLSMKQSTFYINHAFAFLAISLGILFNESAGRINSVFENRIRKIPDFATTSILLAATISLSYFGSKFVDRDQELLSDLKQLQTHMPDQDYSLCPDLNGDWKYYAYFGRYTHSNLNKYDPCENQFLLERRNGQCLHDTVYNQTAFEGKHFLVKKIAQ